MQDLTRIQAFLDQLQDMILEGCMEDFESIAERRDFAPIRTFLDGKRKGEAYWDRLVREAVREQIEIEVYVPLRSVVSRLLVNGWRHEDMEVHFKMQVSSMHTHAVYFVVSFADSDSAWHVAKELRKRPQGTFRIPVDKFSPSNWQSVATILKHGVGMSTLPCVKLRAIVDAAREISRLYNEEHGNSGRKLKNDFEKSVENREEEKEMQERQRQRQQEEVGEEHLGADDFLPIFIFCVVRADMERPCALCKLSDTTWFGKPFEATKSHC